MSKTEESVVGSSCLLHEMKIIDYRAVRRVTLEELLLGFRNKPRKTNLIELNEWKD